MTWTIFKQDFVLLSKENSVAFLLGTDCRLLFDGDLAGNPTPRLIIFGAWDEITAAE